jgi:hypothetical protein
VGRYFGPDEEARVAAALDAQVPGAAGLGAVAYVERLLTALDHDPPHVWAGPDGWLELGSWERHAWAQRIDALREVYARVGRGEPLAPGDEGVLHGHAIEGTYGDPAYGGNHGEGGWRRIDFPSPLFPPAREET